MSRARPVPRPVVAALTAYAEESHGGLNLANNASLFGPNPALSRALAIAQSRVGSFWDYPSLTSEPLRQAAARAYGVPADGVVTGNGSNEMIDIVIRAFADPGERVVFPTPTFSMIPIFARSAGADAVAVPLGPGWELNPDALLHRQGKVTIVCSPNNPTGNAFPRAAIERIVERAPGLVVVDEAYVEFGGDSFVPLLARHPNLVVLRTMSKAHGLAGLRVGFALSDPSVAAELGKVRGPFRLNGFSELVAGLALASSTYLDEVVPQVRTNRGLLAAALAELGCEVFPSDANFLLVRPPVDARRLAKALEAKAVHVRSFEGDLAPYLRITVGPLSLMERFLHVLKDTLAEVRT
ncbi:MAG TPA: histidinol-phosphate transaminase [Candidatus Thermoplasmatota archaeon]|nr:histidinol-phosphate transaminase [Candidatus Thermoplasmatota archaeon]